MGAADGRYTPTFWTDVGSLACHSQTCNDKPGPGMAIALMAINGQ